LTLRSRTIPRRTPPGALRAVWACSASIVLLAGCEAGETAGTGTPPELRLETVQFRAYRGGEASARGTAAQAVYRRSSGEIEATDARVTLPGRDAPDVTVVAPTVVGDLGTRAWSARGGVVLERGDTTVRTASARYAGADGQVRGDEAVEVVGPGYRLAGPSFTADPATGDVAIQGGVRLVAAGAPRP
jgi:hypothetical protein